MEVGAFRRVHDLYRIRSERTRRLSGILWHYSYRDLDELVNKSLFYAHIQGRALYEAFPDSGRIRPLLRVLRQMCSTVIGSLIFQRECLYLEGWMHTLWACSSSLLTYLAYLEIRGGKAFPHDVYEGNSSRS